MNQAMHAMTFRRRLRQRQLLCGTFLKTPAHPIVEVLGNTGLDFIVIDAEHAPFDRTALDVCLLAARARQLPALVRIASSTPVQVLDALDLGATGIVAPHAKSAEVIREIDSALRYRAGNRGYSNSPRAGNYGKTGMAEHIAKSDNEAVGVYQIEDREAVEQIGAITSMSEVDCLFIGRADLAVSYGVDDVAHPVVIKAVRAVCDAARRAGTPSGIHIAHPREAQAFLDMGVTLFIVGSDQSLLRSAASALPQQISNPILNDDKETS